MNHRISARLEIVQFLYVAAFSVVIGGLDGVIWAHLSTKAQLIETGGQITYNIQSTKYLLDSDLSFALVCVLSGLVIATVLVIADFESWVGPGAVVGLTAGGVLGALVAAHVGHSIGGAALLSRVQHLASNPHSAGIKVFIEPIDFKVRWWLGAAAWPFAAVGVVIGVLSLRGDPAPTAWPLAGNSGQMWSPPRTLGS